MRYAITSVADYTTCLDWQVVECEDGDYETFSDALNELLSMLEDEADDINDFAEGLRNQADEFEDMRLRLSGKPATFSEYQGIVKRLREEAGMNNLTDILPVQDHYFLISVKGGRNTFARHGVDENHVGLVVFTCLERAEQFCMTIGSGLNSKPVRVKPWTMLVEAKKAGAICISEGTKIIMATIEGGAS